MTGSFHDLPLEQRRLLANRGTSHYSRHLSLLSPEEYGSASGLEGWDRAHLIAHVAYNAAALCNLMEWAQTGLEHPMYPSSTARDEEIETGATLIPDALRNLHDHTVARLRVAWDETSKDAWEHEVRTAQGRTVPASETLWMRTREVWIHAVDLNAGARFSDIPEVILSTLFEEIPAKWRSTGTGADLVLVNEDDGTQIEVGDAPDSFSTSADQRRVVRGTLAGIVRWAAGRGGVAVTATNGSGESTSVPQPPRWL
ncbi:Putative mycothiol-dependent maleylpyruvate isomerase [Corynebacterium glyciniphilum AJ 3170]|uniref:Putative mycothiol-dependent maleylpyruvate isomerase n=1 Tax=Corynebacterium glyciniphilum AJ 3170 TaxID=1404245 RepID=X5EDF0_9CORY|nr:maleylpyruvate isomerase family mycothiol-dependent enzyme [Corynebacterium glyciniphilum]AHW64646.1 Putative mycothiol-dependent maleylpyruvate isomerase [Corynebacterium glyciniphilum AJ 3170]